MQGERLWNDHHVRKSSTFARITNASCGSGHARAGRDLRYFNYSDFSIQQRAAFHGLSETEAKAVLAYVRLGDKGPAVPLVASAAPLNPPCQPDPSLDAPQVEGWAAGAGLEAAARRRSAETGRAAQLRHNQGKPGQESATARAQDAQGNGPRRFR